MRGKRILAWILCLAMMMSLMPTFSFAAAGDVVQIEKSDGTFSDKYTSLNAAVQAADNGDTIWLIADDTTQQQVMIDKSLTIELQGFDLTDTSVKVTGAAVVSINDHVGGASINKNHYTGFAKTDGDILVIKRCAATIYVAGGSTLKINGVTGTSKTTGTIIYDCAEYDLEKAVFVDGSTLEINGGTFVAQEGSGCDSLFVYNGNVTINDGYFYRSVSYYDKPDAAYPLVIKKCVIDGGSGNAMWVEKMGRSLEVGEIEAAFLSQSAGSKVSSDSTKSYVKIGCTIYAQDDVNSKTLPDGTLYCVGAKDEAVAEEISPLHGDKITLAPQIAGGDGTEITYVWEKDGTILNGETAPTLNISSYTDTDSGAYKVTASQSGYSVSVYFHIKMSETAAWLNTSGNELYVGEIAVTADNAADIIGSYLGTEITGNAYFKVENGVPTLYLNGVIVKEGYKYEEFAGGSTGWYYEIYGIYYKSASDSKLKIKLSGANVVEPKEFTDEGHKTSRIFGIVADDNCVDFSLEGSENARLKVTSQKNALALYSGKMKSCIISINGGEYEFKTDIDSNGEAIYGFGSLKIENAKINISAKSDRGIWIRHPGYNYDADEYYTTGNEFTLIKNSNITINAGTGKSWCDGILSYGSIDIESSTVDITCDQNGLTADDGKYIAVSGADTVVSINSVGPVDEDDIGSQWESAYAAILANGIENENHTNTKIPEITLNDGLAVTTPDAGSIKEYSFSGGAAEYRTVVDQYGVYARQVVIKTPTTHCVYGETNCTSHTGAITHVADQSLNLVSDIKNGTTLTGGSYYLSDDLAMNNSKTLYISGTVNLCLNGHTLTGHIITKDNAVLNICDCGTGGEIVNPNENVIEYMGNNATVNIYGGTIESTYNKANSIIDYEDTTGNVLNLYGGTVKSGADNESPALGSRTLILNLYGGKISESKANGIVAIGKVNLCGNTEISAGTGYDSIKVYKKELIDATGYTGGNITILCAELAGYEPGPSDGDIIVKNVTDETAGKFALSNQNSGYILKRVGNDLVYTAVYTVSFDENGGSGTMASVGGIRGAYELPECSFTAPAGKKFKAWNVDGTEYDAGETITVSKNTTVTAVWKNIEKTTVAVNENAQTFEYDSNAKSFAIVGANVTDGFTVEYKKDGADVVSPTDAGNYDVIISRAEDGTYKEYSKTIPNGLKITPKDITGAAVGVFVPMTYNGNAQIPQASVTIDGLTATGVWSEVTNVADTTTFTANGNFTGTVENIPTGMARANSGVTAEPSAKANLVYDKNAKVLINAGEANGGTLKYSADGETWDIELPKGTNAGNYTVYYKVFGDSNHNDTAQENLNVSIAKASVDIPTVTGKVYTGETLTADISSNEYYTVSENNGGIGAGRYDVKLSLKDSANYRWKDKAEDVFEVTIVFNISSAENEWTLDPFIEGWTYGERENLPSYGAKFGNVKVEYKKAAEGDSTYAEVVPIDAGDYKVRFSVAATDDFGGLSKVVDLTISKAAPSVTAPDKKEGLVYSGSALELTTSGNAEGGEIQFAKSENGTYTSEIITETNAGDYEVWYRVIGDSNHNDIEPVKINVSISKAIQAAPETPAAISETIRGKADGKITGVDAAMEYKAADANDYTTVEGNEIANLPVGTYEVRYKETDNYFAGESKTVEIAAGEMITVTFDSAGGSAVDSKSCEYNQTVTAPETAPTKEGYVFVGWFADSELTAEWNFETGKFTESRTLYAKWVHGTVSEDEGNISDVAAEGLNDVAKAEKTDVKLVVKVQEASGGDEAQNAIKGAVGAPTNFGFYDISLKKITGDAITEAPSVIEIKLPYDFTKKKNIKVYRYHDGNAQELAQLTERAAKPYEDGKCFVDTENGYIYIYSLKFSTYSVAYDVVRAGGGGGGVTPIYTVRFETNGGSEAASQNIAGNGTAKKPADPTKEGYVFDGWYLDSGLSEVYDFNTKVTKNITLYAKWTENSDKPDEPDEPDTPDTPDAHDCPSKEFDDLDISLWYHLDTDYVLANELMKGTAEKIFAPDENLTRAMLVTILYRNESEPAVNDSNSFADVEDTAYYANAVSWAQQNGIVKGISETEFAPNENITREQIASIMHRYAKFKGADVSVGENTNILSYSDFEMVSEYAVAPLQWAVGSGLINGRTETTLNPKENATRVEIAAILHRFLKGDK